MNKCALLLLSMFLLIQPSYAWSFGQFVSDEKSVVKVLKSQVKYANKTDFNKFIKTFDSTYKNSDGFNLDVYSSLVKDIWKTYDNIKYNIEIQKVVINGDNARVELIETSEADISLSKVYNGVLNSKADSIYYLKKIDGKWKVVSDKVIDETTTMLYGEAKDLDITLTVPIRIDANTDYTATLEFEPPQKTIAIASIASDLVEYPQKPTEEIFRALPEDNILERIFTSNNKNANEYVVASIGLTRTDITDSSIKFNLTGFGYAIRRVNVTPQKIGGGNDKNE